MVADGASPRRAGAGRRRAGGVAHARRRAGARCDFYVFSGHKVFAPTGIGVVYGKAEVLDAMPPWQGGGNMIADVTFEKTDLPAAARADSRPAPATSPTPSASARPSTTSTRIGMENIARYEHELLVYATAGAAARIPGSALIGTAKEKAGVLSFVLDGYRTEDVGAALEPRRHRRPLRPPLRPAHAAPLRPGDHRAPIACPLQQLRRHRRHDRRPPPPQATAGMIFRNW